MKFNISRDKSFPSFDIQQFVTLVTYGIPYKDNNGGSRTELMSRGQKGISITEGTKNFKIRI